MDKELRITYLEKEKVELFLSNLERLHADKAINDSSYTTLKSEYTAHLKQAVSQIEQLKREIDKKLTARTKELSIYRQELANLEARHKVGQISADSYFKTAKIPERKVASLENIVSHLTSLANATHSSEVTIQEESGFASLFQIGGRQTRTAITVIPIAQQSPTAQSAEPQEPPIAEAKIPDATVISSLVILPDRVLPGSTVGVIATIVNAGHETVQHRSEFKVNYRLELVSDITLEPGQSSELTFMTIAGAPGDYTVSVDAANGLLKVIPLPSSNTA